MLSGCLAFRLTRKVETGCAAQSKSCPQIEFWWQSLDSLAPLLQWVEHIHGTMSDFKAEIGEPVNQDAVDHRLRSSFYPTLSCSSLAIFLPGFPTAR